MTELNSPLEIQATVYEYKKMTINDSLNKFGYSTFYKTGLLQQTLEVLLRELREVGYSVGISNTNTLEYRVDVAGCESSRTHSYE
jgi:hypothetical protein